MISNLYKYLKECPGISIDSRKIEFNNLFIGIKGLNYDGNIFAKEALSKGAKYAIIDNYKYFEEQFLNQNDDIKLFNDNFNALNEDEFIFSKNIILVKNSLKTLQNLAKYHRNKSSAQIIAITGSCGKTLTKELIKNLLSIKYKTYANPGNYNSHIGLPLALLAMSEDAEIGIFEMGARGFGEIKELCKIANPDYGLITCIKEVHLDGFNDLDGVLKGKTELYDFLNKKKGIIFVNINEKLLYQSSLKYKTAIYTYSTDFYEAKKDVYYPSKILIEDPIKSSNSINNKKLNTAALTINTEIDIKNSIYPYITYKDQYCNSIKTKILGNFNINNISSALCVAKFFKIDNDKANQCFINFKNYDNRLERIEKDSNLIFLDAYNSNSDSLKGAIEVIDDLDSNFTKNKHKILILGELKELGNRSDSIHKGVIKILQNYNHYLVLLCGENFYKFKSQNIDYLKNNKFEFFETKIEIIEYLKLHKIENSIVLLKASRKYGFEDLLDYL
ncbi:MAG: UDP-N-acetylmuramoyl-tripeptide--D-alanyl-D-alanine ligase [Bacteroidetes bacterium]|nr:UDP-N-acetylmuramoyl-tripeptide--D-alanyl-D-alanine ligase [Bacteroidota bacterium]